MSGCLSRNLASFSEQANRLTHQSRQLGFLAGAAMVGYLQLVQQEDDIGRQMEGPLDPPWQVGHCSLLRWQCTWLAGWLAGWLVSQLRYAVTGAVEDASP